MMQAPAGHSTGLEMRRSARPVLPPRLLEEQLAEEVSWYERVTRRNFGVLSRLTALGRLLIALRIANGLTQRELARRLGVDEAQVSRDERNEYYGITLERAQRILDALGTQVVTRVVETSDNHEVVPA